MDIDFLKTYFDEFCIQQRPNSIATNLPYNSIVFNKENYYKQYSAINDYLKNNGRGYWEVYTNNLLILPINYLDFDYRDPSSRKSEPIPDYHLNIFHPEIYKRAKIFTEHTIGDKFDCVYYRYLRDLDHSHMLSSGDKIKNNIEIRKSVFLTSNSEKIKTYFKDILTDNTCFTLKEINTSSIDGIGTASADSDRVLDLATEMIIMSHSDKIHYAGNHHYISLFNYYAHMIKNVPLKEY